MAAKDVEMKKAEDETKKDGEEKKADGEEKNAEDGKVDVEDDMEVDKEPEKEAEPEPPKELEEDAPADKRAKIAGGITMNTSDSSLNAVPTCGGKVMMALADGGFHHLVAAARTTVGVKAGRYLYEVRIVESRGPPDQKNAPAVCRLGFVAAGASLYMGTENEDSVCFESDGHYVAGKAKTWVGDKFEKCSQVFSVLLNLDAKSPNANTISLFRDGERVCQPQPLPEGLKGKALFPTINYRHVTLHLNFGPAPIAALPFKCTMLSNAAKADVEVTAPKAAPKDGRQEVLFPVALPNEGTFEWLDGYLKENPGYTELSGRSLLKWGLNSGLWRKNGSDVAYNDDPSLGFGIKDVDGGTVSQMIQVVTPIQKRNYVAMQVKKNLIAEERQKVLEQFDPAEFKRVAVVVMGEPPAAFKAKVHAAMLAAKKKVAVDAAVKAKKDELWEAKKKKENDEWEAKKKKENEEWEAKKKKENDEWEAKKKKENEEWEKQQKKKEGKEDADEEMKDGEEAADADGEKKEEKEEEKKEEEKVEEKAEEKEEEKEEEPKEPERSEEEILAEVTKNAEAGVELTAEEKGAFFNKALTPDMDEKELGRIFGTFTLPEKTEGFDEVRFAWQNQAKSDEYVKAWVKTRKLNQRVEDLTPGTWFNEQWTEWDKLLQNWKQVHTAAKDPANKKKPEKKKAAAKEEEKNEVEKKDEEKKDEEKKENGEKDGEAAAAADGDAAKAAEGEKEEKKDDEKKEEEKKADDAAEEEEEADEEMEVKAEDLDPFEVADICDIGNGQPIFADFTWEDWMLLTLRYELHLMVHAYRHDMDDEERPSFHQSHLDFYYNKYFRKQLDFKNYGVTNAAELIEIVKDVMEIDAKKSILEAQVSDDTPFDNFVRLTEDHRRERSHRADLGDESGKLNLQKPREERGGHRGYQGGGGRGYQQQSSGYGGRGGSTWDNSRGGGNDNSRGGSWGDSRGGSGNSSSGYGKDSRGGSTGGYNSRDQGSSYQSRDQGRDQGRDQRGSDRDRDRGDRYAAAAPTSSRGGSGGYSRDDDRGAKRPYERDTRDAGRDAGRDTRSRTDHNSSSARSDRGGGSSYGGSSGGRGGYDRR